MKIIGFEYKNGVFNEKSWKKAILYYAEDLSNNMGVKAGNLAFSENDWNLICTEYGITDNRSVLGLEIENVYYNKYGKPCYVKFKM